MTIEKGAKNMPQTYYKLIDRAEIMVWHADESEAFYKDQLLSESFPIDYPSEIKNTEKRKQWYASRFIMLQIYPEAIQLYHNSVPVLFNGPFISFSHTNDDVAVILSEFKSGIDIQWPQKKLLKISRKYMTEYDFETLGVLNELEAHCMAWSIKEAVFKFFGSEVFFKNIQISEYDPIHNLAKVKVFRKKKSYSLRLKADFIEEMTLAYIIE